MAHQIGVSNWGKSNFTTIKHVYIESMDFVESHAYFRFWHQLGIKSHWNGTSDWLGGYGVTGHLCCTQNCLMLGICRLFKPAAMEKWMSFSTKIHSHIMIYRNYILVANLLQATSNQGLDQMYYVWWTGNSNYLGMMVHLYFYLKQNDAFIFFRNI